MTAPQQLTFPLPQMPALGRADFIEAPCNADALARIDAWPDWPAPRLVISGPEASGKSHLAQIWAARSRGAILPARELTLARLDDLPAHVAVEDADKMFGAGEAQEALFHLHNRIQAEGGGLLVTGETPPARWSIALPDLASRLQAMPLAQLAPPDDLLLGRVLAKLFEDRQILPPPPLIPFLLRRMERSFRAARVLVAELDHRALSEGRAINTTLAGEILGSLDPIDS